MHAIGKHLSNIIIRKLHFIFYVVIFYPHPMSNCGLRGG